MRIPKLGGGVIGKSFIIHIISTLMTIFFFRDPFSLPILELCILQPIHQVFVYPNPISDVIVRDFHIGFLALDKTGNFLKVMMDEEIKDNPREWSRILGKFCFLYI